MSETVTSAFLGPAEKDRSQLLAKLARDLHMPDWFGGNLDALFDLLTSEVAGPVRILWRTLPATRAALGRDFAALRMTLRDAAAERDDLSLLVLDEQADAVPPMSRPFSVGLAGL